jgi:two-component system response regulator
MNNEPERRPILLVEDNPYDVELIQRAFRKIGMDTSILCVKDGVEAMDYLFGGEEAPTPFPRVIFLDIKLPRIDGLELLREIKTRKQTRMIPVVVFSSSNETRDIEAAYRLGVNSYLVKPVDYHRFMERVTEAGQYWFRINQPPLGEADPGSRFKDGVPPKQE